MVVLLWKSWNDSICVDSTIINFDFLGMNELIYWYTAIMVQNTGQLQNKKRNKYFRLQRKLPELEIGEHLIQNVTHWVIPSLWLFLKTNWTNIALIIQQARGALQTWWSPELVHLLILQANLYLGAKFWVHVNHTHNISQYLSGCTPFAKCSHSVCPIFVTQCEQHRQLGKTGVDISAGQITYVILGHDKGYKDWQWQW